MLNKLLLFGLLLSSSTLVAQYRQSLAPFPNSTAKRFIENKAPLYDGDKWLASDKAKHFLVSASLLGLTKVVSKEMLNFDRSASTLAATGATLFVGWIKETIDDLSPNNIFSLKDLAADALGALIALAVILLLGY